MSTISESSVFDEPVLNVIHLLNSLTGEHPQAISLASGRPDDEQCDPALIERGLASYTRYLDQPASVATLLCQYSATAGIINELLAEHMRVDEGLCPVDPDCLVVCQGFQEAVTLALLALFDKGGVLLVPDPVFSGITGIAKLLKIEVVAVPMATFLDPRALRHFISTVQCQGRKVRAIYAIPDFSNPTADSLSFDARQAMLDIARACDFYVLEDNAYRYFRYEGDRLPAMKALDSERVFYLGSFAKSIFPGLRMGYVVAPQGVHAPEWTARLCKSKSLVSVHTPALCQAVVGGLLLDNQFSLVQLNAARVAAYARKRDYMLECLAQAFADQPGVSWNRPAGGFFINLKLPFEFTQAQMKECAIAFRVIVFPVALFSLLGHGTREVRLSFSNVSLEQIRVAIERFGAYVDTQLGSGSRSATEHHATDDLIRAEQADRGA